MAMRRKKALSDKKSTWKIRKLLGILTMNRGFVRSTSTQVEENVCVNIPEDYNSWKATENALLEAERKKAEALMHRRASIF